MRTIDFLLRAPLARLSLIVLAHVLLLACAYLAAFLLRFDLNVPPRYQSMMMATVGWLVLAKAITFCSLGGLQRGWRFVSLSDLFSLVKMSLVSTMVVLCIDYLFVGSYQIPRAVLLIDCGATILLFGASQAVMRVFQERQYATQSRGATPIHDRRPAFIVGCLPGGGRIAREIELHPELNYQVVGFLEDDAKHHGTRLAGIPVIGRTSDLVQHARRHEVATLFVISNSLSGSQMRKLVDLCRSSHIELKVIPAVNEILSGSFQMRIRDVRIDDLLHREPVTLDSTSIESMLSKQTVLITGAGGSIGSELCRLVHRAGISKLVLVEASENNLFRIEKELSDKGQRIPIEACLVDITKRSLLEEVFAEHQPDIVFHAAAHKHVPMMEKHPRQAVLNNIFGTQIVADLAEEYEAKRLVMISTDKAVNPTSVMGATKQIAERYVHTSSHNSPTRYVVVRFGNVLASAGSVVPIFQEQIRQGKPITITDPRMERFFMTIPEASQLVLQAAAIGQGGEIFVLDMGEPIKIVDLAHDLIRLTGLSLEDVPIQYVGCRPGEKLTEELYFREEETLETAHARIRAAYHRPLSKDEVIEQLSELRDVLSKTNMEVVAKLRDIVPEYVESPDREMATAQVSV